jgi:tellurite methyltransferase
MQRAMQGFRQDAEGLWVAELACGHTQHVRHQPPFTLRPWVLTLEGRAERLGQHLECPACDQGEMPAGHVAYRRTPSFTRDTVPKALLGRHDTKAGVWALLWVTRGALEFVELQGQSESHLVINAGGHAIIRPEVEHRVELLADVEFYVEFWRAPPR